jgi:hypothetical protein
MLIEAKPPVTADGLASARERVRIGPVPSWVVPCPFDLNFKASQTEHLTYLCINRQVHAENHQTCVHIAMRLETMQAVQRESQWRLQFEPRSQSVTVHSISIRRGEQSFEHANLAEFRLLQREEGLEGYVIDGWFTLLLVLEDVRPGDVLEWCYTIDSQPRLLPQCCASFFSLPQGIPVGKFGFSVRFNESRPMKWKSSSEDLAPAESREDGQVMWVWAGENQAEPKPEGNTPPWHIAYPWVQVSDCPDWKTVALAMEETWEEAGEDATLAEIARELADKGTDILPRVEGALELVQDQCRYLSINLELGGHVPTAPGLVARRRFGDCKDLSFLLVHLLRRLGVPARPVLVNSTLRKSVAAMLPMPGLFNHVVVEYTVEGKTRWVDATMRRQGGGPLDRFIPDYGVGLPLDSAASDLVTPPPRSGLPGIYELKESILLDTEGAPSLLAAVTTARGFHAESLRQQLDQRGAEELAKERLQIYNNRFFNAKRVGECELRDDRAANELVLAEVYEISGFLGSSETPDLCSVPLANNLVVTTLPMPEQRPHNSLRRTPLALPHPCNIIHTIEVQNPALRPFNNQRSSVDSPFLKFSRNHRTLAGYWSATLKLSMLADAVLPDQIDKYRTTAEEVWQESMLSLLVGVGHPRPRQRGDFGRLPALARRTGPKRAPKASVPPPEAEQAKGVEAVSAPSAKGAASTAAARLQDTETSEVPQKSAPASPPMQPGVPPPQHRRHHRHDHKKPTSLLWPIIISVIVVALAILLLVVCAPDTCKRLPIVRELFAKPRP